MSRTILLTGASRGLGLEIARNLLESGARVIALNRSHTDDLAALLSSHPDRLSVHAVDLEDGNAAVRVFREAVPGSVRLDGFVNNAAMAYDDIVTNLDALRLERMFRVNVFTPMLLTKYAIRNMLLHRRGGSLVHISSISAHTGYKGLSMYAASKAALEGFSRNTAREWGERGIRSNCVVAGFMETAMSRALSQEQKDRIYRRTSLKQPTSVESVASMCAFLLGEGAASVTGQEFFVDSGTI